MLKVTLKTGIVILGLFFAVVVFEDMEDMNVSWLGRAYGEATRVTVKAADSDSIRIRPGQKVEFFGLKCLVPRPGKPSSVYLDQLVGPRAKTPVKLLLLGFFASWCVSCKQEFARIQQIERAYRENGLVVIMINIDDQPAGIELATRYIKECNPYFPVLTDKSKFVTRRYFKKDFALPATFLVASNGRVVEVFGGSDESTIDRIETSIGSILGKPAGEVAERELPVSDDWAPDANGPPPIRTEVTKVRGKKFYIDLGKRHGVQKKMTCRYLTGDGREGSCKLIRVRGAISRLRADKVLSEGDRVILTVPE